MTGFGFHVVFHLPVAAVATVVGVLLCRYVPWRIGYVVTGLLYGYYVVVISIMGEGIAGVDHAGAYTVGIAVTLGVIFGVRAALHARGVKKAVPSEATPA